MGTRSSIWTVVAILVAVSLAAVAQNQNQNQNQQTQTQQTQTQPTQTQQAQPQPQQQPKKKGFWQKIQDMTQQGQNTVQNGQNTIQNGVQNGQNTMQNTMQQGTGAVQGATQGVQGAAQSMPGTQQGMQAVAGGTSAGTGFAGMGGGSPCGPSCFNAGPFQANVSQMTMSQQGGYHIIRMNIQFHNATNQPLIIAYHDGSMTMVDNNGATYQGAGGSPGELQGMGIDRGSQTDSQFQLAPGQIGNAMFSVARYRDNSSPIGTTFSYNLTIDELQAQNGAMAIPLRSYSMNFPSLSPNTTSASFPAGKGSAVGSTATRAAGSAAPATQINPQTGTSVAPSQQKAAAVPAAAVKRTAVNNAIMKSTTTAKPTAAVKPIPTTTTSATTAKKATTTTTNQTNTTTPK